MLADVGWRNFTKCDGWCLDLTLRALVSFVALTVKEADPRLSSWLRHITPACEAWLTLKREKRSEDHPELNFFYFYFFFYFSRRSNQEQE